MIRAARLRRRASEAVTSLAAFIRHVWPVIEPGVDLSWNWHIGLICAELEAVTRGETQELVICVPPGTLKSVIVSVCWPTWEWLLYPHLRGLHISNSDRLCARDSRRARDIIQSEAYRQCVRMAHEVHGVPLWELSRDQAEKVHFANTEHGARLAVPTGAKVTGDRGDKLVIDDPIDATDAVVGTPEQVMARMEEVQHKYDHVWASRLNDPQRNPRVTIMQRLAPGDLAGVLIDRGVRCVVLPMEFEPDSPHRHPDDPRTERSELLFGERFDRAYLDKIKATPGASRHYQAQYQQAPPPLGGGSFKREWFRYYQATRDHYLLNASAGAGDGTRRRVRKSDCWRIMVCDNALTAKSTADFSVVQVWDIVRRHERQRDDGSPDVFASEAILVDQWRGQVTAPDLEQQIQRMLARYKAMFVAIEQTTASLPIIQRFQRDGLPVRGLKPSEHGGDKAARAVPASIWTEAGKVFFPLEAEWLGDFESELLSFPGGSHDDQVDSLAWAIIVAADRDAWVKQDPEPYAPGTLGDIAGHNRRPKPKIHDPFGRG